MNITHKTVQTKQLSEHVAQLRQEKRRLARSKARAEAFLEAVSDGLVVIKPGGTVVTVNRAFERMLGWRRKEVVGRHVSEVFSVYTEDGRPQPFSKRPCGRALKTGKTVRSDRYLLARRDGSRFRMEISVAPITQRGKVNEAMAIFRDIDERWVLQQRQQQFVSTASHELRTPLTALMGYLSMARGERGNTSQFTERAFSAAQRLGRLVEDLLHATRIDNDKLTLKLTCFNPASAIRGEMETLRTIFDRKGVTLTYEDCLGASDRTRADKDKYTQVIVNLLDNALKYTPSGGRVTVITRAAGKAITTTVNDTGVGIKPDNLRRVFEKFYREENELSVSAGGVGLGLPIAKELVERQGGKLDIDSRPAAGTTVRISLPRSGGVRTSARTKVRA